MQGLHCQAGAKAVKLRWLDTLAGQLNSVNTKPSDFNEFTRAKAVVSCSGDLVHAGSHVVIRKEGVRVSRYLFSKSDSAFSGAFLPTVVRTNSRDCCPCRGITARCQCTNSCTVVQLRFEQACSVGYANTLSFPPEHCTFTRSKLLIY